MGKRFITDGAGKELAAQLDNIKAQLNGEDTVNVSSANYNSKDFLSEETGRDIALKIAAIVTALKSSKSNSNGTGSCSTAASTAAKVVTLTDNTTWKLAAGSTVTVKFTYTNTAQNPTLNVNGTGAKRIWYSTGLIATGDLNKAGYANRYITYVYDGTQYVFVGWSFDADTNTTYTNASLGSGYGTCSTAASTAAKVVTLSGYTLTTGGTVSVKFTYAVPADATMNINSRGAKSIYYRGVAITADVIKAGDVATFVYNGTQYVLLAVDRVCKDGANGSDGLEGLSIYLSKSTNLSESTSYVDITSINRPSGRKVKVGDLILSSSQNAYLYQVSTVTNGSSMIGVSYVMSLRGATGATGADGEDGVGISSITLSYAQSTTTTRPTSWNTSIPTLIAGRYMHYRLGITLTSGTTSYQYWYTKNEEAPDTSKFVTTDTAQDIINIKRFKGSKAMVVLGGEYVDVAELSNGAVTGKLTEYGVGKIVNDNGTSRGTLTLPTEDGTLARKEDIPTLYQVDVKLLISDGIRYIQLLGTFISKKSYSYNETTPDQINNALSIMGFNSHTSSLPVSFSFGSDGNSVPRHPINALYTQGGVLQYLMACIITGGLVVSMNTGSLSTVWSTFSSSSSQYNLTVTSKAI